LFVFGYRRGTREAWRSMLDLAAKATRLDPDDASFLAFYAGTLAHMGEHDQALELSERAVSLNPSISYVYQERGRALFYDGQYEAAVETYERYMQLSPNDPMYYTGATMLGYTHYCRRNHEAALSWANEALRFSPNFTQAIGLQAASLARLDRIEEAKASTARFLEAIPLATATRVAGNFRLREQEDVDHYRAGLVKAGLPEE
jgi:adenylate cyclase